jgi:hypothetical protein
VPENFKQDNQSFHAPVFRINSPPTEGWQANACGVVLFRVIATFKIERQSWYLPVFRINSPLMEGNEGKSTGIGKAFVICNFWRYNKKVFNN